jgi:Caspase domain
VGDIMARKDKEQLMDDAANNPPFKRVIAVVVALETYRKPAQGDRLPKVDYAHADADAFAEALKSIYGYLGSDNCVITVVKDADASLTALQDLLGYTIRNLSKNDLFVFYYAGHGFHGAGGNRLSAYETNAYNIEETSLHLQKRLLEPLEASACERALIFVDACAKRFADLISGRDVVTDLNEEEVRAFLDSGWYCAVFLSCSPGQSSFPAGALGHGVWTYHLLQALVGKAPAALTRDRWLTDTGLRDWLRQEVPRFITREMSVRGTQTPQAIISGSNSFRICHVAETPSVPTNAALAGIQLKNKKDFLEGQETGAINRLDGFKRGFHTVPDSLSVSASSWVSRLLAAKVGEELQQLYSQAKEILGLRRKDVRQGNDIGSGDLDTPVFRYSIETEQNPSDPSEYVIYRRLSLREGWADNREAIGRIFGDEFNQLVVEFETISVTFDELVEKLEDIQEQHGGKVEEDERIERAIYTTSDGSAFSFDLAKRRLEVSFGRSGCLDLVDAARDFQLGLTGRNSPMLLSSTQQSQTESPRAPGTRSGSARSVPHRRH